MISICPDFLTTSFISRCNFPRQTVVSDSGVDKTAGSTNDDEAFLCILCVDVVSWAPPIFTTPSLELSNGIVGRDFELHLVGRGMSYN